MNCETVNYLQLCCYIIYLNPFASLVEFFADTLGGHARWTRYACVLFDTMLQNSLARITKSDYVFSMRNARRILKSQLPISSSYFFKAKNRETALQFFSFHMCRCISKTKCNLFGRFFSIKIDACSRDLSVWSVNCCMGGI